MSKAGWLIGTVLGGGTLAYLLWPREAEASTEPLQRAQQTMDTTELPPTPPPAPAPRPTAPKPVPAKKSAPKKPAAKPTSVDDQIAQMRAAVQKLEMERNPTAALEKKRQLAVLLKAEADRAELSRDQMRANALREQVAALGFY